MILVNGKEYQWHENLTIDELITNMDLKRNLVLIQANNQFIDQSRFNEYAITDGMDIKIFNVMSGG